MQQRDGAIEFQLRRRGARYRKVDGPEPTVGFDVMTAREQLP